MRRLGSTMDNRRGSQLFDQPEHACSISNIEFVMNEPGKFSRQTSQVETGVTLRTKDHRALIVVYAVNFNALPRKVHARF